MKKVLLMFFSVILIPELEAFKKCYFMTRFSTNLIKSLIINCWNPVLSSIFQVFQDQWGPSWWPGRPMRVMSGRLGSVSYKNRSGSSGSTGQPSRPSRVGPDTPVIVSTSLELHLLDTSTSNIKWSTSTMNISSVGGLDLVEFYNFGSDKTSLTFKLMISLMLHNSYSLGFSYIFNKVHV